MTIPESVTQIGNFAFQNHRGINIYIKDLQKFLNSFPTFDYPFQPEFSYNYRLFVNNQEVNDLVIPDGMTRIPEFKYCASLISVTLKEGNYCQMGHFQYCVNLKQATFPNSYQIVPPGTFANSGLTTMTIGNNVTTINYGAFLCPIKNFYSYTQVPPAINVIPEGMNINYIPSDQRESFIKSNKDNATLYVPAGCKAVYESSDWATYFGTIVEMEK